MGKVVKESVGEGHALDLVRNSGVGKAFVLQPGEQGTQKYQAQAKKDRKKMGGFCVPVQPRERIQSLSSYHPR